MQSSFSYQWRYSSITLSFRTIYNTVVGTKSFNITDFGIYEIRMYVIYINMKVLSKAEMISAFDDTFFDLYMREPVRKMDYSFRYRLSTECGGCEIISHPLELKNKSLIFRVKKYIVEAPSKRTNICWHVPKIDGPLIDR